MYFGYFVIIFPLEKVVAIHLSKPESSLPIGMPSLIEIGQVLLEKMKTWKV